MDAVLFWDIDGTLLTTGRAGILAWEEAVRDVTGRTVSLQEMPTGGLTDVEIARHILTAVGAPAGPSTVRDLLRRYEALLPFKLPLRTGMVLAGVPETLEAAAAREGIGSLLLTGNTRAAARAKLNHYGLARFFDSGAFADDGEDRPAIARRAVALARELFGPLPGRRLYVIGDTPHDIACGAAIEARTIAVATGPYPREDLERCRPWWVLDRLPPPAEFLDRVLSP